MKGVVSATISAKSVTEAQAHAQGAIGLVGTLNTFDYKTADFTVFLERLKQFFIAN